MFKLTPLTVILALLSSAAIAQDAPMCSTEDPACHGSTNFGPAKIDRCISIRGAERTDFCQVEGQTHSFPVRSGDRYCAVAGSDPVPEECELHWINVTEPE